MTRMEIHFHIIINHLKVLQIGRFGKLILTFHIHIIHQDVFVLSYQLEGSGSFYGIFSLLLVVILFFPLTGSQRLGRSDFNAIAMTFGLIEHVIYTILIYNITIYT